MLKENESVTFFVCRLCLRLYTLKEDLRGHMMQYHGWKAIVSSTDNKDNVNENQTIILPPKRSIKACENTNSDEVIEDSSVSELRPMPFKSFRLLLRANLSLRCLVSNLCGYKFEEESKLQIHTNCHNNLDSKSDFKCYECGLDLPNWRQCSIHLWKMHKIDADMLHCPVCKVFKAHMTVHVWRHMRVHKKWRSLVLRTLRAVQRRRELKMIVNDAITTQNPIQNKNKYYSEKTCEICTRKFVNGKTLSKHVKTVHNKIKPFICNICGMKTARKASLNIHMRQHTGEKPLKCTVCKFSTRDPSVLKMHQKRHNQKDNFNCDYCSYSCIQTISLKRHIRLRHPEALKDIACDLCNFVTAKNQTLLMHKEDHRRGLIVTQDEFSDTTRTEDKSLIKSADKNNLSADCFHPLESIDSLPHEPAVDTGGVTIPAPSSEDTQFPTYLNH